MSFEALFGVPLPIIQAPMAGVQGSALAIAVSEAGGLGSLPCAMLAKETIRTEVATIRARTKRPFNLNFFCHSAPRPDPAREGRWKDALAKYYAELGVDPSAAAAGARRAPFDEDALALVEELRPPVVSFHFGLPREEWVRRVKATGAKVLSSATTLEEARWLEARGVDAIIAQGVEAGGHRGDFLGGSSTPPLGTSELVRRIVTVLGVPIIAAGGIADAKGVVDAMKLGAVGAQIGTAYLLCPEATTSAVHRAALASAGPRQTALTNVFSGRPARGILNRAMRELGPMSDLAPEFPLASAALAPLRAKSEARGSGDFSPLWCGESSAALKSIPAGALTRELASALGGER